MTTTRRLLSEASGAVADLGILVPIAGALVLTNGLDPATVLVGVGALYLAAGLWFRVPVPVQPIKAAAAIAIARGLPVETIAAAGIVLGIVLLTLGTTRLAGLFTPVFATPVVRGLQCGVGLILIQTALHLGKDSVSQGGYVVAALLAAALFLAWKSGRRLPLAFLAVAGGIAYSLATSDAGVTLEVAVWRPQFLPGAFNASVLMSAFTLLVIPQIPLTFGNAVVAFTDVERKYFGDKSRRVTPATASLSCGVANVVVGSLGGMPMCHGSSGLTAHYRAGARTKQMNVMIGATLLTLGMVLGPVAFQLLALIPLPVLMGLLAFAGTMHAALVADQRGYDLVVAVAMGVVGVATANLAVALALGLATYWPVAFASRLALDDAA
ncbi:MAG: putative sulfate/molybdate transporter [Actinomycetota bacterium]